MWPTGFNLSQHMEVYDLTLVRHSSPVGGPVSSHTAIDRQTVDDAIVSDGRAAG